MTRKAPKLSPVTDRRDYPRLSADFKVRCAFCSQEEGHATGFTRNIGLGGVAFVLPRTDVKLGDTVALEVSVPGFFDPLYFLGTVIHRHEFEDGIEVGVRFDWLGKTDRYKEKLASLVKAHAEA